MIRRPPRSTQSRSSAASDVYKRQPLIGLGGAVSFIYHRYLGMAALVALGVLGAAVLARRRAWVPLAGALALGPGILVFVLYLGWRRIWISDRYLAPADLTL